MEAEVVDKLVDKAKFQPEIALAIAEAMDVAIKAANLVTVPVLDARFAAMDAKFAAMDVKIETRFASVEKSISSAKVWAVLLYAALVVTFFTALAADHHYLASREDQLDARFEARMDRLEARQDATLAEIASMRKEFEAEFASYRKDLAATQTDVSSIKATLGKQPKGPH